MSDPVDANIVAGGGVFVTYSDISEAGATLHIKTDVADDSEAIAPKCTVRSTLMDAEGRFVQTSVSDPVMLSAEGHHEFVQTLVVDSPRLWHPDHPNLYTLVTTVSRAGQPTDEVRTRLGIRTFALGRGGLHINGKSFPIHGSNRHQEYPYLEYALSPNAGRRDAQHIKDGGFNHIRLSHYPQDPRLSGRLRRAWHSGPGTDPRLADIPQQSLVRHPHLPGHPGPDPAGPEPPEHRLLGAEPERDPPADRLVRGGLRNRP